MFVQCFGFFKLLSVVLQDLLLSLAQLAMVKAATPAFRSTMPPVCASYFPMAMIAMSLLQSSQSLQKTQKRIVKKKSCPDQRLQQSNEPAPAEPSLEAKPLLSLFENDPVQALFRDACHRTLDYFEPWCALPRREKCLV